MVLVVLGLDSFFLYSKVIRVTSRHLCGIHKHEEVVLKRYKDAFCAAL